MPPLLDTIRVGRTSYLVEQAKPADARDIPVRFILHSRSGKYLVVPEPGDPDSLIAIRPLTPFARFRPTPKPFHRTRFAVEAGKLVVARSDA